MALVFISECLAVFAFTPKQPIITIAANPPNSTTNAQGQIVVPSNTALNTIVALVTITMSDNSAFTGTVAFDGTQPGGGNDGNLYGLSGSGTSYNIFVNGSITGEQGNLDNVYLVATNPT